MLGDFTEKIVCTYYNVPNIYWIRHIYLLIVKLEPVYQDRASDIAFRCYQLLINIRKSEHSKSRNNHTYVRRLEFLYADLSKKIDRILFYEKFTIFDDFLACKISLNDLNYMSFEPEKPIIVEEIDCVNCTKRGIHKILNTDLMECDRCFYRF